MFKAKYNRTGSSALPEVASSSDGELLRRCREGDEQAWEQVVENYKRLIYSIPLNFGLNSDDAADVFQLTFASLVEHLERLRPDSNLGAWLATVARRHALHQLRKRKREQLGAGEDIAESEQLQSIVDKDAADRFEQIQTIDQGLNQIARRCRDLLLALYFDPRQPSYEEIADLMNIPVGSIGPTRGRCLDRLKEVLSQV
ncbi:MAG TPA: sigma-70 family RNA polymerase sigma factor [Anaerolineales bacterium]|nr:sigma-70 family RNA polymerase sigma factor [Anaerolineales bacterium]